MIYINIYKADDLPEEYNDKRSEKENEYTRYTTIKYNGKLTAFEIDNFEKDNIDTFYNKLSLLLKDITQ